MKVWALIKDIMTVEDRSMNIHNMNDASSRSYPIRGPGANPSFHDRGRF